jgi:AcrR family transcriptional regulator
MSERQEATRERLLTATLDVLGSRGVAQTTSREIATAAGVNLQAITYHFGSKDELVGQALVHAVRTWIEPARAALTGIAGDPLSGLLGTVSALQQALEQATSTSPPTSRRSRRPHATRRSAPRSSPC